MNWITGLAILEVAFTSGLALLGWAYQSAKTEDQQTADFLRDTNDPRLDSFLETHGGPAMTAWDLFTDRAAMIREGVNRFGLRVTN